MPLDDVDQRRVIGVDIHRGQSAVSAGYPKPQHWRPRQQPLCLSIVSGLALRFCHAVTAGTFTHSRSSRLLGPTGIGRSGTGLYPSSSNRRP
jgi:hypothetical protein